MNAAPNLDCMDEAELRAFWRRYHRPSRRDAEELVGSRRRGYVRDVAAMAAYAISKAAAISCRLAGNIQGALRYEEACDLYYEHSIPPELRW